MASTSSFLFLILCGYGVHGSNMELASALQTRMESHAQAPWKAQAQAFMGLLQSMGKQVPGEKQDETRRMLSELITFLQTSSSELTNSSQSAVTTLESEMGGFKNSVKEYNGAVAEAFTKVTAKDTGLAECYAALRTKEETYRHECLPSIPLPESCRLMEAGKKKKFAVAKKFTWKCDCHNGGTADSCTNSNSDLSMDLNQKNKSLEDAYAQWLELKADCERETKTAEAECERQRVSIHGNTGKKAACDDIFREASELLCHITTSAKTREEFSTSLNTKMEDARLQAAWKEEKKQWEDLQLIICVLKRFRTNMNFAQEDYNTCQGEVDAFPVPAPAVPDFPPTKIIDGIEFRGGLSDKYLGMPDVQGTPALSTKAVALNLYLPSDTSEAKMYLKLADADAQQSCKVADSEKDIVAASGVAAAEKQCADSSACKFFELGGGNSRMGNIECIPQTDNINHYTIMRKVCNGGARN